MKSIEGIIIDPVQNRIFSGKIWYDGKIQRIEECETSSKCYLMPGLVDAHIHVESSMLTPFNYSKIAMQHGVVAAVTDPHEIANVCGVEGVEYMIESAALTPMKIYFGIPSCVPATSFETSGGVIDSTQIEQLFKTGKYSHLSEMMNFPGVIYSDADVIAKLAVAKSFGKRIDGHAPMLCGDDLAKYVAAGITTDHECTSIEEAIEKIRLGMKIMLRKSSASNDFEVLMPLIEVYSDNIMFCVDDCHPDDLLNGYINRMVKEAIHKGYDLLHILKAASVNPVRHYNLNVGLLQVGDPADFIVVDNLSDFNIVETVIDGETCWDGTKLIIEEKVELPINNFFVNAITVSDLEVQSTGKSINVINVIDVIPDSLLTKRFVWNLKPADNLIESDTKADVLKIVVLNRYQKALPVVGFIRGFGFKHGAIAGSIAHDSHNIISIGVDDHSILRAINLVQEYKGGLVVVTEQIEKVLPLPVAGLMNLEECGFTATEYQALLAITRTMGCSLYSPFMTMAFMALLVIPELKIGDKGLFDVTTFNFINLQNH